MSCERCSEIQNIAFDKNIPKSTGIAYVRINTANVAIVGCKEHVKIAIERLRK